MKKCYDEIEKERVDLHTAALKDQVCAVKDKIGAVFILKKKQTQNQNLDIKKISLISLFVSLSLSLV